MMIEVDVISYLSGKTTAGTKVYAERPDDVPDTYIIIEKTSGGMDNRIKHATIAVQSIAPTLYGAMSLNEEVKTAMDGIISLGSVSACRLNSDYNFTDQTTKEYRYQAVFDITHY